MKLVLTGGWYSLLSLENDMDVRIINEERGHEFERHEKCLWESLEVGKKSDIIIL